jgi:hypothetical protein
VRNTSHINPLVSLDGPRDNPLALIVSRRQTGDKQTRLGKIFLRDHRRVRDIDERLIGDTVFVHFALQALTSYREPSV